MRIPTSEAPVRRCKELSLLLRLLAAEGEPDRRPLTKEEAGETDWRLFLELAVHHRVVACLYPMLNGCREVPAFVMQAVKREHQKNVIRMLGLSGEMERLCRCFAERGIRVLQLKGPGLAFDLFGDLSLRSSKDLDLLVDIRDLQAAEQLLREMGYSIEGTVYTLLNGWKWRNYHRPFLNPDNRVHVEIHWRLGPGPSREPDFDELWERKRTGAVAGCPVFYLGKEDLFYFLVAHGARHAWFRLQWLRDIDRMARQSMNGKIIGLHLSRYQALHIGAQALLLCSELLGTPLDESMRAIAAHRRGPELAAEAMKYIDRMLDLHGDLPPGDAHAFKRYLYRIKSGRQKLLYLLSALYPHPLDARTLPLPGLARFLYFPLKPFLWMWRKTRRNAWT